MSEQAKCNCGALVVKQPDGTGLHCGMWISGECRYTFAEPSPEVAPTQGVIVTKAAYDSLPQALRDQLPAVAPRETQREPFVRAIFEAFYADAKDDDAFEIFQAGWNAAITERGR